MPHAAEHIRDFASAGIVEARAIVTEVAGPDGQRRVDDHAEIQPDVLKRIWQEGADAGLWSTGTVRLVGSDAPTGPAGIILTGIRFDAIGLVRIIRYHRGDQPKRLNSEACVSDEGLSAPIPASSSKRTRIPPPSSISLDGEFLKIIEAQAVLRCGHSKLYDLIKAGELEKRQTKAGVRITTKSVKAVLGIGR